MSDNNQNNQDNEQLQGQNQEGQEIQGQEGQVEKPDNKPEGNKPPEDSEGLKNLRNALKAEKSNRKAIESKLKELEEKGKPDKSLEDEIKDLKAKFENSQKEIQFAKKESEILTKLTQEGLNPKKLNFVKKYLLNNLVSSEDYEAELETIKSESPELFQQAPKNYNSEPPSGGANKTNLRSMSIPEFMAHRQKFNK